MHLRRTWYLHVPAQTGYPNSRVNIFDRTYRPRFRLIDYFDIYRNTFTENLCGKCFLSAEWGKNIYTDFYGVSSIAVNETFSDNNSGVLTDVTTSFVV